MRNQATTNAHNNERLKERIRPLLVASDGVAEPVIGPARLMRIVSEIWNAVISADESDPYCFSSVWLQVSECLRNESVATGKKERFGLFVVALESFLEVLNRRLLAFSDDQIVSVFSGLQWSRLVRAVRDLRLQYSDDSVALATIGRYVTLRERYDQVRDLLKRIGELLEHGCSGGPTAPHRHIILQDAAMIIAEKLDRGCDNVAMVETLKETAAVLLGVERIEDARSIEVIREVPWFDDITTADELFRREEYLSILLQQLAARGVTKRSGDDSWPRRFFKALSTYASKRLGQKKRLIRLAWGWSDTELVEQMRENGVEKLYESARAAFESRQAWGDLDIALREAEISRFVPNRYGIPVQRVEREIYDIYGYRYSREEVPAVLGNFGYFSMFGLTFILPMLPEMVKLLRGYFPSIAFSLTTPLPDLERAKMLAGFLFVLGIAYPDGTRDVGVDELERAERICLDILEDPDVPSLLERARECWFVDRDDRIVMGRFIEFVIARRNERGLPSVYS